MRKIQILGTGCPKCKLLLANTEAALKSAGLDAQLEQVLSLVRKLEGLDADQLQEQLVGIAKAAQTADKVGEVTSKVFDDVKGFFSAVGNFFTGVFGEKKTE